MLAPLAAVLLAATPAPAPAAPAAPQEGSVILFLVDNSASLPPLDPDEKRVEALEKMFGFLEGQPYRLVLFGGRNEVYVDDVHRYRNNGQWTDFFFAFQKVKELIASYPRGTDFKIVMLTDAIVDPAPADWEDQGVPHGQDPRAQSIQRTLALVESLGVPLYVILVGNVPADGVVPGDREQSPAFVLDLVRAANGREAAPLAQSLASFFKDDGVLLKKFVFRVAPHEGLKRIEPAVRRIAAPPRAAVELKFLSSLALPLSLFVLLLLGILVRSFPGPGDVEIVELNLGVPVHLAVDRLHRLESGGWGGAGLSLLPDAKGAAATLSYQAPSLDVQGLGLDAGALDELSKRLVALDLDELKRALDELPSAGSKEDKIYALNLDYVARNFDPARAEQILLTPPEKRRSLPALDFLRAKAHLLSNAELRRKLLDPRVHLTGYGRDAEHKDMSPGSLVRIGPYGFVVRDIQRGGRKDVRVAFYYDSVPSLLGLKSWLPARLQRAVRLRRSSQRVVN
ncbi:MAG TPA: hypothetical protein VFM88_12140 [Vicinamibacteria bacterium]|nr:hypothetical protein [Vicinamibacteria bacterium]